MTRQSRRLGLRRSAALLVAIAVGEVISVSAHNGFVLPAPINPAPAITIDGTKSEPAWGAGTVAGTLPNTCEEFGLGTGSPVTVFATKDATNFYLALTIPDTSPNTSDRLLVFFDANHAAGVALQADDVAYDLPFGTTTAPIANARKFTGTSPTWALSATFPATVQAAYTRSASDLVVEMKIPTTEIAAPANAAIGFAFVYLNQTEIECTPPFPPAQLATFKVVWPPSVSLPAVSFTLPDAVNHPNTWGDLGKNLGTVTFNTPVCCDNQDIQFLGLAGTTFPGNTAVPIEALLHPGNAFDATNVRVQIKVHKFGTGGPDIFNGTQPPPVTVPASTPPIGQPTSPGIWTTLNETVHTCIETLILAPANPDDYAIGASGVAQRNANVVAVAKSMIKRLEFNTFNPDNGSPQLVKLLTVQRGPRPEGLTFELAQLNGPLGPLQEATATLVANVGDNTPVTDLPRQRIHVPPTAGRVDGVAVQVKAGDRLQFGATGDVDIDAGGPAASAGPGGTDVSNVLRGRFLLSGESAARVGGALIGSFDGFETSFLIGETATVIVPEKNQGLRLAINDLVERNADNTGRGFDIDVWTLQTTPIPVPGVAAAAAAGVPALPELNIAAAVFQEIRVTGVDHAYNVPNRLGAVAYQFLITEAPANPPIWQRYWWLILLILLAIILLVFAFKKPAKV